MTVIARPNAWVTVEDDPATQLTYAPRVDPAPLTVSVPGRDPTLGSLVVVITNQGVSDLAVTSVTLTITVGTPGAGGTPLTPTTAGVKTLVSDTTTWSFTGPSSPVTSGTADYVLAPASGTTATLAAGASVWLQIYDFQTVPTPSTSQVTVEEVIAGGDPAFTNFQVSTFPDGFYFDSLTANALSGSALVPVAQVASGATVTLTWNSSVVDTKKQTVYWSSATAGQQQATPTKLGAWTSPALTSDTVFVVVVTAADVGGEPLTAALATAVSVQNPALVASSVQTGGLTVTGNEAVAGTLAANGGLTASAATVAGALTANGGLTASAATVNGPVTASGELTASGATINGQLHVTDAIQADAGVTSAAPISASGYPALTANGNLQVTSQASINALFAGIQYTSLQADSLAAGNFTNKTPRSGNWITGVYVNVAQGSDWGLYTTGRIGNAGGSAAVTHLETRNGHRVVTSPLTLAPEVQISGRASLSGGRATVELDPEAADMIAHGDGIAYRVLVTPTARCNGLAVTAKTGESFEVEELLDGTSDAEFDWLVIARTRRELGSPEPDALPESLPDVQEPPPIEGGPS